MSPTVLQLTINYNITISNLFLLQYFIFLTHPHFLIKPKIVKIVYIPKQNYYILRTITIHVIIITCYNKNLLDTK